MSSEKHMNNCQTIFLISACFEYRLLRCMLDSISLRWKNFTIFPFFWRIIFRVFRYMEAAHCVLYVYTVGVLNFAYAGSAGRCLRVCSVSPLLLREIPILADIEIDWFPVCACRCAAASFRNKINWKSESFSFSCFSALIFFSFLFIYSHEWERQK